MYTALRNVQILIALLKEYNISQVVLSPGGSNIPIIHSIEQDAFFQCYSVVDERSAAFFALGIAIEKKEPVAAICTSGTAAYNFMSAAAEAYYKQAPLVLITCDKHPYLLDQMETQKLDQSNIYRGCCKKAVNLPIVNNIDDFWYCQRLINEALLEINHHGCGPVQINIPTVGKMGRVTNFSVSELPKVSKIERLEWGRNLSEWEKRREQLEKAKKILVIIGERYNVSEEEIILINKFALQYNCVISIEHMSNVHCNYEIRTYPLTEMLTRSAYEKFTPDIVITCGGNVASYNIKTYLRYAANRIEHWSINETGLVKDTFKALKYIYECTPQEFFGYFSDRKNEIRNDSYYYGLINNAISKIKIPQLPFSNFYVASKFAQAIPSKSLLHLGILDSTRHMQFYDIDNSIKTYSNLGALGIDGSMSTFLGQAAMFDGLSFLLIGDLSFFYDMNSVWIRGIRKNVRILMVNNGGGGEFHVLTSRNSIPQINDFIAASHQASARGWVESIGFKYLAASDEKEFIKNLEYFVSEASELPLFFEVFTNMEVDGDITKKIYADNSGKRNKDRAIDLIKATMTGKETNSNNMEHRYKLLETILSQ